MFNVFGMSFFDIMIRYALITYLFFTICLWLDLIKSTYIRICQIPKGKRTVIRDFIVMLIIMFIITFGWPIAGAKLLIDKIAEGRRLY